MLEKENIDYFIFGHRHLEMKYRLRMALKLYSWVTGSEMEAMQYGTVIP